MVDSSDQWTALVGSRGGKTTMARGRLVRRALDTPRAQLLYLSTTEGQAEKLLWGPLKELDRREQLDCQFLESKLLCKFPHNGSWIQLGGCATKADIENYRGIPHHDVIVDECGSHNPTLLRRLVEMVLEPRLDDFEGSVGMMGTPSHVLSGPFYDITRVGSEEEGWSRHSWCVKDVALEDCPANPNAPWARIMRVIWARQLARKEKKKWSDDHPVWKREYLGLWAADDTEGVFKFRRHDETGKLLNAWKPERDHRGMAILPPGDWDYHYSLDDGTRDPMALTIWAGDERTGKFRQVYEFQKRGMHARPLALMLLGEDLDSAKPRGLIGATGWPFKFAGDIGDGLREELKNVYGIIVEKVEKRNKHDYVELVNGDFLDERMWILDGSKLMDQTQNLQWATDDYGHLREHKGMPNHLTDTMIYARRGFLTDHTGPDPQEEQRAVEAAKTWEEKSLEKLLQRGNQSDYAAILAQGPPGEDYW